MTLNRILMFLLECLNVISDNIFAGIILVVVGLIIIYRIIKWEPLPFRAVIAYVFLLISGCMVVVSAYKMACNLPLGGSIVNIQYESSDKTIDVTTITTTLFTTLYTVALTLLSIDVTAYIFLDSVLQNRREFEQDIIKEMKRRTKGMLIYLSGGTGTCLALGLIADNGTLDLGGVIWLRYCIVFALAVDILFLLTFLYKIINYEKSLISFANKIIEHSIRSLGGKKEDKISADLVKKIGDIEVIFEQLVRNHEAEYHNKVKTEEADQIRNILKSKTKDEDSARMAEDYQRLIQIRNCFLFLGSDAYRMHKTCNAGSIAVAKAIDNLISYLGAHVICDERFDDLSLNDIKIPDANLKKSSFPRAALIKVVLSNACLEEADFRGALLQEIDLSGANCTYAIFEDTKFFALTISPKTDFTGAVFRGADLSTATVRGMSKQRIKFERASCERTNFIDCKFEAVDFNDSVFQVAQLTAAKIENCSFSGCDLEKALLVSTEFLWNSDGSCRLDYANLTDVTAVSSRWKGTENSRLLMEKARIARGNFAKAKFEYVTFLGAYANDTSFIEAEFIGCQFDNAIMIKADLTDSKMKDCSFRNANFADALFVHSTSGGVIENTHFNGANFTNAEIRGYTFKECCFDKAIFHNSLLRDVIFENCTFGHAQFSDTLIMDVKWKDSKRPGFWSSIKRIDFGTRRDFLEMLGMLLNGIKR